MSKTVVAMIALLSGVGLAAQVGFNSGLRERAGHAIPAALISFLIGTTVLGVYTLTSRPAMAPLSEMIRGPWWIWMGGIVGAVYVACSAAFGRKLGAGAWLGLIITGQLLGSMLLDHYGLVGFHTHPMNGPRLLGAAMLLGGVALVLRW